MEVKMSIKSINNENKNENNIENKFELKINGTLFTINLIQSKDAKLTYEELIEKIILDEAMKINAENSG